MWLCGSAIFSVRKKLWVCILPGSHYKWIRCVLSADFRKVVELLRSFSTVWKSTSCPFFPFSVKLFMRLYFLGCRLTVQGSFILYSHLFLFFWLTGNILLKRGLISLLWSNQQRGWLNSIRLFKSPRGTTHSGGRIVYSRRRVLLLDI